MRKIEYCDCYECGGDKLLPYDKLGNVSISNIETPWAIDCYKCGLVYLSNHEYNRQMNKSNHF